MGAGPVASGRPEGQQWLRERHYYPGREQVLRWFEAEGLGVVAEAFDQEDGWGYRHWLVQRHRR
jgi:hypothetical protein